MGVLDTITGNGLIGGIASLVGNIFNYNSTKKTNESNQQINQNNLDFQRAMTQAQWERDDNAHQRQVADLEAAGLSPLAATQGANTSQALGAPSPIAMQAPQVDLNNLVQAALQDKALNETARHNKVQEGQKYTELSQQAEQIKQKAQELSLEDKKIENTFIYQSRYISYLTDALEETNRHNKSEESLKRLQYKSEEYFKSIQAQTHGKANYKIYTDLGSYEAALTAWSTKFENFINTFISDTSGSVSNSNASSKSGSAGISAGGSVLGTGGKGGINGEYGTSNSQAASSSFNVSQKQQAELERFYATNPMPVYYTSRF